MLLKRAEFLSTGIFGILTLDDGSQLLTLEHAFPQQADGLAGAKTWAPIVQPGTYQCVRRKSPHFGYDVFMLEGVAGHSFVEIHRGNSEANSEGCILLGTVRSGDDILESKIAFDHFMNTLNGINIFQLIVE